MWPKYLNIRIFKYIRHTLTRSQARSQLNAASLESSRCDNNIHIFIDFYWKIVNQLFPLQVPIPCYASWFYSWEWLVAAWNWNGSMPSVQMRALDVQDHGNDEHSQLERTVHWNKWVIWHFDVKSCSPSGTGSLTCFWRK